MNIDTKTAARLLGGDARGNRILCPGPGHSKRDRSLSVTFHADGSFTTNSFAGDDFRDCRDHVKAILGMSDDRPVAVTAPPVSISSGSSAARIAAMGRLWASCVPIRGTLGERYLARRGLSYDGDGWRYRPMSRALIGIIVDALTGDAIGYHETILDPDGNKTGRLMHGRASAASFAYMMRMAQQKCRSPKASKPRWRRTRGLYGPASPPASCRAYQFFPASSS